MIPSSSNEYEIYDIGSSFISNENITRTIRNICRKHGVGYILHRTGGNRNAYRFFIATVPSPDKSLLSPQYKSMTDCINELDNRTSLFFANTGDGTGNCYAPLDFKTYRELSFMYDNCNVVEKFVTGEFGNDYGYLTFYCGGIKVPEAGGELLSEIFGNVYREIETFFRKHDFDTVVRITSIDKKELCGIIGYDGISMARKFSLVFGREPDCDNCSVYVVQMTDGSFCYVICRDGAGYYLVSEYYSAMMLERLLTRYVTGDLKYRMRKRE